MTRGKSTTEVPVNGGAAAANSMLRQQSDNVGEAGRTVPRPQALA